MSDVEKTFEEDKTLPWNFWGQRTILFFFYDFWFRVAAVLFIVLVVFLSLFIPKIWRASPEGFIPVMKVSGLDKFQAWQLRRAALKHEKAGELVDAMYSWRSAILNDPCDPELHRGALRTLLGQKVPSRDYFSFGVRDTFWLMRLTRTNAVDVDLSSSMYELYQLDDMVQQLLLPLEESLTPDLAARLLRASFHRSDMLTFGRLWKKHGEAFKSDPVMQTYFAAWRSGWGEPGELSSGRRDLQAALEDPARRGLAHQLRLLVSLNRGDLREYEESFEYRRENHVDRVLDNVNYWRLLAQSGRREDAIREARAYANPPSTPGEVLAMGAAFRLLGLDDYVIQFIEKYLPNFPWAAELWAFQGNLMVAQKRWDDLRALAVGIRADELSRELLGGYSYFLEGLAHQGMRRTDLAVESFNKTPSLPFDSALRAFSTAMTLNQLGQYQPAAELLRKAENGLTNRAEFYNQLAIASFQARQMDNVIAAAARAHELAPENLAYANNYAAALLAFRQRPAEALRLTIDLHARNPNSPGAIINHALALNQNSRFSDAADLLKDVLPGDLSPEALCAYDLAWIEIHARQGHPEKAREIRERIEARFLTADQLKWVDQLLASLSPKPE